MSSVAVRWLLMLSHDIDSFMAAERAAAIARHLEPPSLGTTRVQWNHDNAGSHTARATELTADELYVGPECPVVFNPTNPDHMCSVCHCVKSHPVWYRGCKHSHCYVCARLRLQEKWTCPDCRAQIYSAPKHHHAEETEIAKDHPDWTDASVVSYSWSGLKFPRRPKRIATPSP
ncbi:hypothetical protein B0H17DRAFT_1215410 [Mycena rosella]|uniref:RING-type domain-containing protein n=1 Tax=Mycena rosella TaxID=1033263 RepID=A0AAD7FXT0_MYCRO|nr:hypothetical protein B0H17DRAFT_1215410 [Mycena rosella]